LCRIAIARRHFEGLKRTVVYGKRSSPPRCRISTAYDDGDSTKARRWGVGFDQKLGDRFFAGVEWSQRRLKVPITGAMTFEQDWEENLARSYVDWVISDRFSANLGLQWERFVRDPAAATLDYFIDMDITRVP
jgi:hypothetical protein